MEKKVSVFFYFFVISCCDGDICQESITGGSQAIKTTTNVLWTQSQIRRLLHPCNGGAGVVLLTFADIVIIGQRTAAFRSCRLVTFYFLSSGTGVDTSTDFMRGFN